MQLPKGMVIRQIGKYVHILNPYSARVVTIYKKDYKELLIADEQEIDKGILSTLRIPRKKTISSRKFRPKLIDLGAEYRFPTIVNIEITRRCLLDCKHCYITSEEHKSPLIKGLEELNRQEAYSLIKELHNLGVFLIVLTGGEPMISKNFLYFLDACLEYNMIIEIFSCLQIVPDRIKEKSSNNIGRFQVSIYSIKSEVHDSITNKNGSLKRSLKNIQYLKDNGYYIEVATPIMKLNYEDRKVIREYFDRIGVRQDFSWPIFNEYYSERTNKSNLNISKDQFLQFVKEDPSFIFQCSYESDDSPICVAGVSVFSVAADGNVFPCSQFPMSVGNIFNPKENIKSIYNGRKMEKVRSYSAKDLNGEASIYNFCMGNNYSETGDPLKQPLFIKDSIQYCLKNLKEGGTNE